MSSNTVRDRSGQGLPSKAERRALGKAAARKRAQQRRRKAIINRAATIAAPIVVVGIIVGAIVLFGGGGGDEPSDPTVAATTDPGAPTEVEFARAETLDPALDAPPTMTAGEGTLTELRVTTIVTGTGPVVQPGDEVEAHYIGAYYATGEVFQSSWDMGGPITFDLDRVIAGWSQGLAGVTVGSRVQLDIPFALAYENIPGDNPQGDLRFIVDIYGARP